MKMMRMISLLSAVAILGACDDPGGEDAVLAPTPPLAYTRFVNGVADTGSTDWRFIDILEYSPTEFGLRFRDFSPYAGTATGTHTLRIFPTTTNIDITKNHIIEAQVTLEAGKYYTILHTGYADASRTPADQVIVIEDQLPTVGAGNLGVRFIHAGMAIGAQDAFATDDATTSIVGATPMFTNIAYGSASSYNTSRASGTATPNRTAFRIANTGTTTVTASALSPVGAAAVPVDNLTAIGGYSVPLSVMTGILFPASVTGTSARSFASAGVVWLVDRHPN